MINHRFHSVRWTSVVARIVLPASVLAGVAFMNGCAERYDSGLVQNPAPGVEAVLVVSDVAAHAGAPLFVSVKANAKAGTVGSYTARIGYDPTALRYDGEVPLQDEALRAVNPQSGVIRFAGAATTGFVDGRLASYKFVVLRDGGAKTLSLGFDEMHMTIRSDAKANLVVAPVRATSR